MHSCCSTCIEIGQKMYVNLIFLISCFFVANGRHLPKYIKPCQFSSHDFKKCAIQHGNEAVKQIVKGDRAYGVPSFLPFKISFVSITSNGFEMNLTEATFHGVENMHLQDYEFDPVKKYISVTMSGPLLKLDFDYSTKGQIGGLPIIGNGHGWTDFINGNFTYGYEYGVKEEDGKHYMTLGKDKIIIEPERLVCEFDNLFNGNKQLGDNLNKFLNENWRDLLKEFTPVITEVYGSIAKGIIEKLFDKIALEEIFPGVAF